MNQDPSSQAGPASFFLPLLLLVTAFNLFLIFEVHAHWNNAAALKKAGQSLAQQASKAQSDVAQSRTVQTALEGLANDLIILSATDADARRIVDKYQIRRGTPPSGTTGKSGSK